MRQHGIERTNEPNEVHSELVKIDADAWIVVDSKKKIELSSRHEIFYQVVKNSIKYRGCRSMTNDRSLSQSSEDDAELSASLPDSLRVGESSLNTDSMEIADSYNSLYETVRTVIQNSIGLIPEFINDYPVHSMDSFELIEKLGDLDFQILETIYDNSIESNYNNKDMSSEFTVGEDTYVSFSSAFNIEEYSNNIVDELVAVSNSTPEYPALIIDDEISVYDRYCSILLNRVGYKLFNASNAYKTFFNSKTRTPVNIWNTIMNI